MYYYLCSVFVVSIGIDDLYCLSSPSETIKTGQREYLPRKWDEMEVSFAMILVLGKLTSTRSIHVSWSVNGQFSVAMLWFLIVLIHIYVHMFLFLTIHSNWV